MPSGNKRILLLRDKYVLQKFKCDGKDYSTDKEGQIITKSLRERLYGALWKLMEYEDTDLTPEEAERLNDFEKTQAAHLLKRLNEEQDKHRWIPVEERLPEKGEIVLVTIEGDYSKTLFTNGVMFGFYKKGWFVSDDIELKKLKVTAWQPLPEPYREDEEN